jgi:hypothetical protein
MKVELWWSDKCPRDVKPFAQFFQKQLNRLVVGYFRYEAKGAPASSEKPKFAKRARMELSAYAKTGNTEHLINAANYCSLEYGRPSHARAHFDANVESATRGKV